MCHKCACVTQTDCVIRAHKQHEQTLSILDMHLGQIMSSLRTRTSEGFNFKFLFLAEFEMDSNVECQLLANIFVDMFENAPVLVHMLR